MLIRRFERRLGLSLPGASKRTWMCSDATPRRWASSTSTSSSSGSGGSGFRAATRFKLAPGEVNETNAPSAAELSKMLPSVAELSSQLPDARSLEDKYINHDAEVGPAKAARTSSAPHTEATEKENLTGSDASPSIFVKTTDPLEDLIDGKERSDTPPDPKHVILAYRALAWGTFYAIIGFIVVVFLCMRACGYRTIGELLNGVRDKARRDELRLRQTAERDAEQTGDAVIHYNIDLTNPTEAYRQMVEIFQTVQQLAKDSAGKEGGNKPQA